MARVGRERDRREEADEKPDLVPLVELSPAREMGGDAPFRERIQERRRVRVVADEDGEVAVAPTSGEPLAGDALGYVLGFERARGELKVVDLELVAAGPAAQPLVDPEPRLEAVGVLLDEAIGRVEDPLPRAAVLDERDHRPLREGLAEGVEVRERGPAPGEDRLIVVADNGDVAVRIDQQTQELELGVVRVLELVHEDVAIPILEAARRRRPLPQEPERERDLIAEVDDAVALLQGGVRGVDRCELLLRLRFVRRRGGIGRRPRRRAQRPRVLDVVLGGDVLVARAAEEV